MKQRIEVDLVKCLVILCKPPLDLLDRFIALQLVLLVLLR